MDKRQVLAAEVFTYQVNKAGKVFIYWHGKPVTILAGSAAQKLISKIEQLNALEAQLLLAKATGNFKRGNER